MVTRVTDRLNLAMEAEGEEPIPYGQVEDTFKKLVSCRFLERLPAVLADPAAAPATILVSQDTRFAVPAISVERIVSEKKRRRESDENQGQGEKGGNTRLGPV